VGTLGLSWPPLVESLTLRLYFSPVTAIRQRQYQLFQFNSFHLSSSEAPAERHVYSQMAQTEILLSSNIRSPTLAGPGRTLRRAGGCGAFPNLPNSPNLPRATPARPPQRFALIPKLGRANYLRVKVAQFQCFALIPKLGRAN